MTLASSTIRTVLLICMAFSSWPATHATSMLLKSSRVTRQSLSHRNFSRPARNLIFESPCAPPREELVQWHVSWLKTPYTSPRVTFFLHYDGGFNLEAITKCYLDGLGKAINYMDRKVSPQDAEHSTDFRLVQLLRGHPKRSRDAEKATIHIVGAPLNTAFLASRAKSLKCVADFSNVTRNIAQSLRALEEFRTSSKRFVFIDTDWRVKKAFGEVLQLAQDGASILASADPKIAYIMGHMNRSIVLPYKTHYKLEDALHNQVLRGNKVQPWVMEAYGGLTAIRDIPVTFHGNLRRKNRGSLRGIVMNLTRDIEAADMKDVDFEQYADFSGQAEASAQVMLRSRFCLVPEGDTPSTRRLFDALAAGCVPVIFATLSQIAPSLPFRRSIDWSKIAIFAGQLQCVEEKLDEMKRWLSSLVVEKSAEIDNMRRRGRDIYNKFLSYKSNGLVDAFLGEFHENGTMQYQDWVGRRPFRTGTQAVSE